MATGLVQAARATKQCLDGMCHDACHEACNKAQPEKLALLLGSASLCGQEGTELAREISSTNWATPCDLECVLSSMLSHKGQGGSAKDIQQKRASLQDYTHLHNFLPSNLWDLLTDMQVGMEAKLNKLQLHSARLGLCWPSERTSQLVTALLLLCQCGLAQTLSTSHDYFLDLLKWVKRQLRVSNTNLPAQHMLLVLPATPGELQQQSPELHSQVINAEPP